MNLFRRLFGRRELSCRQVGQVLQTYLDDELDDEGAAKVAEHLEDCRRCGLEAEIYDALKGALHRLPDPLPAEPVDRLRVFGERLVAGEPGSGSVPVP